MRGAATRIPIQIDIGVGDTVYPRPAVSQYSTLLPMPQPRVVAYARETVIAEKVEAMVVLGDRNSRIKDFFDIWFLAREFPFERPKLTKAIATSFRGRNTAMPDDDPIALTAAYWENPIRAMQFRAFARRSRLDVTLTRGLEVLDTLRPFLLPIIDDVRRDATRKGSWPPGGPWS